MLPACIVLPSLLGFCQSLGTGAHGTLLPCDLACCLLCYFSVTKRAGQNILVIDIMDVVPAEAAHLSLALVVQIRVTVHLIIRGTV